MKINDILKNGIEILNKNNIEESNLKSRIILAYLINKDKEYIIIHDDEEIDEGINKIFLQEIERLINYEPIQYIINHQEFMGFDFYVDKNVLIPQPDTENLVEEVIKIVQKVNKEVGQEDNHRLKILDLCTGSGAIGISLAKNLQNVEIYALDISEKALEIARKNAIQNKVDITFIQSDLFNNIQFQKQNSINVNDYTIKDIDKQKKIYTDFNIKFDIIVSNPPYIETDVIKTLSEEVKKEPKIALDGGEDGLDFYREIIENAKYYLNHDGYLAFEIGYNQKDAVENLLKNSGYKNIYSKKDLAGNDRIVVGNI